MEQKTFKIFLASSNELKDDRIEFGNFIRKLDKIYRNRGIIIDVFEWEDYDAADNDSRKQDEYNDEIRKSNMFLALFYKKAGIYTIEEYEVAISEYHKKKSPKVYVYCKTLQEGEKETPELIKFKDRLNEKNNERFWNNYSNNSELQLHFIQQFLLVENSMMELELEGDKIILDGLFIAELANLPFAAGNKNYIEMKEELDELPEEIELAHHLVDEHPNDEKMFRNLQKKQKRFNVLKKEFKLLQNALFETSQRIALMRREQHNDKLLRATEAFERGNLERTNALLDEIVREAGSHLMNLSHYRSLVHQDIYAYLLKAKTIMADVSILIDERKKQIKEIYEKADNLAKDSALPTMNYVELLEDYAHFLFNNSLYIEAERIYLRLIILSTDLYGEIHPKTATFYDNTGGVYYNKGDYTKALYFFVKALAIREQVLNPEHPDIAISYDNIGGIYHKLGNFLKALEYYEKASAIFINNIGLEHSYTVTSFNNVGGFYYSLGNYPKALKYLEKALIIREQILGFEHPDTATTLNNIGGFYYSQGNYLMALEYLEKALVIREQVLGFEHPDTATSYNNIGLVFHSQNNYTKALNYYEKALVIREQVLGFEHPDTATSYNNIGGTYYCQGDYTKALEYYGKALKIIITSLGVYHSETARLLNNIGLVYQIERNYPMALDCYRKSLTIREQVLSPEHPDLASSYNNIGSIYFSHGDLTKAMDYYNKALSICERMLGPSNPNTNLVKQNIELCKKMSTAEN
jgi:tetratricopeptide (TPR) repeat protein